ncbi:hypothetical protein RB597_004852 [Gaeumannomyces tritici]
MADQPSTQAQGQPSSQPQPAKTAAALAATQSPAKHISSSIPVGLNEAALDSPSFRAASAHFGDQTEAVERWLDAYVKSASRLVLDATSLEETINNYISKTSPAPAVADGVIDTDFTLLALKRAGDLARERWSQFLASTRRIETLSVEPIRNFMSGELRVFRDARRQLDQAQRSFDTALARYMAQSKIKEPSALREDAFALYETRKSYLKSSMDYCQLAPQVRYSLDKLLIRVSADIWREMMRSSDPATSSAKWADEMDRIRGWAKELESSEAVLKRELQAARRSIGETTLASVKPSRELDDYSASTVPFLGSRGPLNLRTGDQACVISEKQGWLFLRTISGKPAKVNWVRRWYYCRDGIFGWLVAGPSGVLQGDEIGVLLCSAKPAVQEERRFCFEVKTKSQTLVLQAETQAQLIEWLEVFEVAKKQAFEASLGRDNAQFPGGIDPAFAITPPSVPEFSARSLDTQVVVGLGLDDGSSASAAGAPLERTATMGVPGSDTIPSRPSSDVGNLPPPRRAITALGREEGESNRDHATRLMRKALYNAEAGTPGSGTIAGLISASHNLVPATYAVAPPQLSIGSLRPGQSMGNVVGRPRPGALAPFTFARPPSATALSKNAVLVSGDMGMGTDRSQAMPTALMANYWGSNSWGAMYSTPAETPMPKTPIDEDPFGPPISVQSPSGNVTSPKFPTGSLHRKPLSADVSTHSTPAVVAQDGPETFPKTYPAELKPHHSQFRLLFPNVPVEEKLVLVFNAGWSSSSEDGTSNQSLVGGGRIYVTPDNMYFYGFQMGLITAYKVRLDIISEVTAAPGRECDFIFLHLGHNMNDTGFTRITIKVFLESLTLLHARLNLLIDDLQAEEPMDITGLIQALVNLEKEDLRSRSSSVESWEEVPSSTPADDGTPSGRATYDRMIGGRAEKQLQGSAGKLQLPAHPVIYEPEDMQQMVAERHFEISAKACFHVLFGDKSFIFPKLYFERRAKEIAQGPWELADHGKMKRHFRFKVECRDMLGRRKPAQVEDTQTIEVFSDHVTYVVKHVKTPWHLPHSGAFKLVTKVVITHLAKSKCKLAIWTKVDWSKTPAFSKNMVERQASDDAVRDAEELAEVATDQVRRLGPHSRTKRAIQVYGHIGQQTQVVVFTPGEAGSTKKPQIKPRTLTNMIFEVLRSFMESVASSLMMWTFAGFKKLFSIFSANRIILAVLAASVMTNVVFTSKESSTWWAERRAAKFMNRIGVGPNVMMSKAIYVADLDQATESSLVAITSKPPASACYDMFRGIMNSTDMDLPYHNAGSNMLSGTSKAAARRLRRTRQRLGSYRHDLVVAMRVVNSIERELIQSEWENWLLDENLRCEQVKVMLAGNGETGKSPDKGKGGIFGGSSNGDGAQKVMRPIDEQRISALRVWHGDYCGSCRADQDSILKMRGSPEVFE